MNTEQKAIPPKARCEHCGRYAKDHLLVNYADGPLIGRSELICPTSTFKQQQKRRGT
jgi:hypothetical protein